MAVPKKVLRRAVDRNAVKRAAREALRARLKSRAGIPGVEPCGLSGESTVEHTLHLRLLSRPVEFNSMSRPARKRFWRAEIVKLMRKVYR